MGGRRECAGEGEADEETADNCVSSPIGREH